MLLLWLWSCFKSQSKTLHSNPNLPPSNSYNQEHYHFHCFNSLPSPLDLTRTWSTLLYSTLLHSTPLNSTLIVSTPLYYTLIYRSVVSQANQANSWNPKPAGVNPSKALVQSNFETASSSSSYQQSCVLDIISRQ